jgi:hypothetical protein
VVAEEDGQGLCGQATSLVSSVPVPSVDAECTIYSCATLTPLTTHYSTRGRLILLGVIDKGDGGILCAFSFFVCRVMVLTNSWKCAGTPYLHVVVHLSIFVLRKRYVINVLYYERNYFRIRQDKWGSTNPQLPSLAKTSLSPPGLLLFLYSCPLHHRDESIPRRDT